MSGHIMNFSRNMQKSLSGNIGDSLKVKLHIRTKNEQEGTSCQSIKKS